MFLWRATSVAAGFRRREELELSSFRSALCLDYGFKGRERSSGSGEVFPG